MVLDTFRGYTHRTVPRLTCVKELTFAIECVVSEYPFPACVPHTDLLSTLIMQAFAKKVLSPMSGTHSESL